MEERIAERVRVRSRGIAAGSAEVPGSKSLTNRALLAAASAAEPTLLRRASLAEDSRVLAAALRRCGVGIEAGAEGWRVSPTGVLPEDTEIPVDLGEAGTVARFLPPWLASWRGTFALDGRGRLRERPMRPLAHALVELGARVETGPGGALPWRLRAQGLSGTALRVPTSLSSQFVSGLLLSGPRVEYGELELLLVGERRSWPYVRMTIEVMRAFGAEVRAEENSLRVAAAPYRSPGSFAIEADASGAAFLLAAAAITGGEVRVPGLAADSLQGDARIVALLGEMGVEAGFDAEGAYARGPATRPLRADLSDVPDLMPPLVAVAATLRETSRFEGVGHLRVKESDRLAVLARGFEELGASCRQEEDAFEIRGPLTRSGAPACAADHRMAMAFALAGLGGAEVVIEEPGCVSKSFPAFFETLAGLAPGCVD